MRNMIFSANIGKALCLATMGISLLSTVQVAVAIPAVAAETQVVNRQGGITVFPNREAQYRIPAIVECKSGKLIAFTDHRYHNQGYWWRPSSRHRDEDQYGQGRYLGASRADGG